MERTFLIWNWVEFVRSLGLMQLWVCFIEMFSSTTFE